MPVPDFQSLMLPMLRIAPDRKEHSLSEARQVLSVEFHLTEADLEELLPSGRQSKFANRVAWAKSYLQQAGLVVSPRRGYFQLSPRGQEVLNARLVVELLLKMGYGGSRKDAGQAIGRSGDEGIEWHY
jgi:restriction system protein